MLDLQFFTLAAVTIIFSLLASLFHYYRFFKRGIAIAIVTYSLLVYCIVYFVSFENNLGLGIGLLGILSLVRLRSTPESPTDIGFIFYSITIGLLNASIDNAMTAIFVNTLILFVITFLASGILFKTDAVKTEVTFDDLVAEKLHDHEALMKRVEKKFGIRPLRIKVKNINYLRDSITIEVTYDAKDS